MYISESMSRKGQTTTASILKWGDIERLYIVALNHKMYSMCRFIIAAACYGLHAEQVLSLKWKDVLSDEFIVFSRNGNSITVKNTKYAKAKFLEQFALSEETLGQDDYIVKNRYDGTMSLQMLNRHLKNLNVWSKLNVENLSTESFRKTFARRVYDLLPTNLKNSGLEMLSQYLGHASLALTREYIGLWDRKSFFKNPKEMFEYLEQLKQPDAAISDGLIDEYENPSYVYLAKDSALPKLTKIGKADDTTYREGTLQGEKPSIFFFKVVKCENSELAYVTEKMLHKRYKDYRIRGEWFELPDDELNALLSEFSWEDA